MRLTVVRNDSARRRRAAPAWFLRIASLVLTVLITPALAADFSADPTAEEQPQSAEGTDGTEEVPERKDRASIDERLDALLSEALPEDEYRETQRCLGTRRYRSVEVLGTEYLLFYKGDNFWLNKLSRPCPTLAHNRVPVFEAQTTSSLCSRDLFFPTNRMDLQRGFDSSGRPLMSYGICVLGEFETISVEQAALLRGR